MKHETFEQGKNILSEIEYLKDKRKQVEGVLQSEFLGDFSNLTVRDAGGSLVGKVAVELPDLKRLLVETSNKYSEQIKRLENKFAEL